MTEPDISTVLTHHGDEDDPTLVFLHGSGLSREVWTPHVEELADDYHCVTVDFPGHGRHPEDGFSYDRGVETVNRVLDAVGPAALVGHSMGGYAAMMAAEERGDDITGMCLAGSATNWRSREILLSPLPALQFVTSWLVQFGRHHDGLREWYDDNEGVDIAPEQEPPEDMHDPLQGVAHEMRRPGLKRTWPGAKAYDGPITVVYGNDESRIEQARQLADEVDGVFREMDAPGHGAPVEAPAEFTGIVREFAERVHE